MVYGRKLTTCLALCLFALPLPTVVSAADTSTDDESLRLASDTESVVGSMAEEAGAKSLGTTARSTADFLDVYSIGNHLKDGDIPSAVGVGVSNIAGRVVVPMCAAGGGFAGAAISTSTGGTTAPVLVPAGMLAGAAACQAIVNNTGRQAKQLAQETIDTFQDIKDRFKRSTLQKLVAETGINNQAIADKYDFYQAGQHEKYMSELLGEIERVKREEAQRKGIPYKPDPRIAALRSENGLSTGNTSQDCGPMSQDEKALIYAKKERLQMARAKFSLYKERLAKLERAVKRDDRWPSRRRALARYRSRYQNAVQELQAAQSAIQSKNSENCQPAQAGSGNSLGQMQPDITNGGYSISADNMVPRTQSNDPRVPPGYRRVSPNACMGGMGDVIRC